MVCLLEFTEKHMYCVCVWWYARIKILEELVKKVEEQEIDDYLTMKCVEDLVANNVGTGTGDIRTFFQEDDDDRVKHGPCSQPTYQHQVHHQVRPQVCHSNQGLPEPYQDTTRLLFLLLQSFHSLLQLVHVVGCLLQQILLSHGGSLLHQRWEGRSKW